MGGKGQQDYKSYRKCILDILFFYVKCLTHLQRVLVLKVICVCYFIFSM